jgi:hypothetical protein
MKCPAMKLLITPTQSEKFDRCSHLEHIPILLYVRKDHRGAGGFEIAGVMKNPLYDPETAALEGEGIKKSLRRLKKSVKVAGRVDGFAASGVALVAPQIGFGLGVASAVTRAVLGDGEEEPRLPAAEEATPKKKKHNQQTRELPRYAIAKKKASMILDQVIMEVGHSTTTSGRELDRVMRQMLIRMGFEPCSVFGGVYAIDRVPQSNRRYQIVNTDPAPGRHWFAVSPDGCVYDSLKKNGDLNDVEQNAWERNCGQRAIAWILLHVLDRDMAMAL